MANEYKCGDCDRFLNGLCFEEDEEGEICEYFKLEIVALDITADGDLSYQTKDGKWHCDVGSIPKDGDAE